VVAADGEEVAISRDEPDLEIGFGEFDAGGEGGGAAVDGVEAVGVHVVGEAGGAADTGDKDEIFAFFAAWW